MGNELETLQFTHMEYRRARVAQLVNMEQEYEFYYNGKPISMEDADRITQQYMDEKEAKRNTL